jgi:hypothetical protein
MSEKRLKNQIELAFTYAPEGEALRVYGRDRRACGEGGNRKPDRQLRAVKSSIADVFNQPNRRVRNRMHGGVGGAEP